MNPRPDSAVVPALTIDLSHALRLPQRQLNAATSIDEIVVGSKAAPTTELVGQIP